MIFMKNSMQAGFARLDITPPLGVEIPGGWDKRYGDGVLDPLYVNALAFRQGEKTAVVLVLDMLGMYQGSSIWHTQIAQELNLPRDAVFLCSTHSHTTPKVDRPGSDAQYDKWLFHRLCEAADLAIRDCRPVKDVQWAQQRAQGKTFVRRFYLKDGTVMTNPPAQIREQIVRPACEADDSLRLIRILREEGPEIALVNFQCHPDNTGGTSYSADYPGVLCSAVEAERENVRCVFLDGAEGQMVPGNRMEINTGLPGKGRAKAEFIGLGLAALVLPMFERTTSTRQTGLAFGQKIACLETKWDAARLEESRRIVALYQEGKTEQIHPVRKQANYIYAEALKICQLDDRQICPTVETLDKLPTPVSAIAFGGMALVGIPGEPFCEIGVNIRADAPFPVTCVCCQTNGSYGYFPDAKAYDQGGYEAYNTPVVKGSGEVLVATALELLNTLGCAEHQTPEAE